MTRRMRAVLYRVVDHPRFPDAATVVCAAIVGCTLAGVWLWSA